MTKNHGRKIEYRSVFSETPTGMKISKVAFVKCSKTGKSERVSKSWNKTICFGCKAAL